MSPNPSLAANGHYHFCGIFNFPGGTLFLCEILIAEAKKVLLIIILKRKNLNSVYFPSFFSVLLLVFCGLQMSAISGDGYILFRYKSFN